MTNFSRIDPLEAKDTVLQVDCEKKGHRADTGNFFEKFHAISSKKSSNWKPKLRLNFL